MRFVRLAFAAAAFVALALPAAAVYPERPITMIVPFAPAGSTDVTARIVAAKMSEILGQQIIVENKAGAGGTIGSEEAARATPDGYTIILHSSSSAAINVWLYKSLSYDVRTAFVPISLVTTLPNVLVVNPSVPARSVQELIALLKAHPGEYDYGSSGNGTVLHLSGALFARMTGVEVEHVPYGGGGPAMNDLIAGNIDFMFDNLPAAMAHIRGGSVVALAVTTKTRSAQLPDLPTMEEAGVIGYDTSSWTALYAPAGTPDDIVRTLAQAAITALQDPATRTKLIDLSSDVVGSTPDELKVFWESQIEYWKPIVEASGATIE